MHRIHRFRLGIALSVALLAAPSLAACGASPGGGSTQVAAELPAAGMAGSVELTDGWVKAAENGMTGVFGVLENQGTEPVILEGAEGSFGHVFELHETVPGTSGSTMMQAMEGGVEIPVGGTHGLLPGGEHIMVMDLVGPLDSGDEVSVTLLFADQSRLEVPLVIKDYAGAQEVYVPDEEK